MKIISPVGYFMLSIFTHTSYKFVIPFSLARQHEGYLSSLIRIQTLHPCIGSAESYLYQQDTDFMEVS